MATKQGSSLQRHSRRHHRLPFNRSTLFHSAEVIPTVALRLLYYSCFLCLILNTNCDFAMVQASYSEADDLINELDRPSKYQTLVFASYCSTPFLASPLASPPTNWNGYMFCVRGKCTRLLIQWIIRSRLARMQRMQIPFVIISTLHCGQFLFFFVFFLYCFWCIQKTSTEEKPKWKENALFPNPLLSSWSIETTERKKSAPPRLQWTITTTTEIQLL